MRPAAPEELRCGGVNATNDAQQVQLERLGSPRVVDDARRLRFNPRHVTFSPDGRLFGWSDQKGVHVWNLETARERPSPTSKPFNPIQNLSFLPDNQSVVFVTQDRWAEIWDTAAGRKVTTFDATGPGDRSDRELRLSRPSES